MRRLRSYRALAFGVVALLAAGGAALTASLAGGETPTPGIDRVSNQGAVVASLRPDDARVLTRIRRRSSDIRLLGGNSERALYRIGPDCYGVGPAGASLESSDYRLGAVTCTPEFPSDKRPILPFTVLRGKFVDEPGRTSDEATVWKSEGVASDAVSGVGFRTADGEIVGQVPVVNNVYVHGSIPRAALTAIVALDAEGDVLAEQPLTSPDRR